MVEQPSGPSHRTNGFKEDEIYSTREEIAQAIINGEI